MKDVLTTVLILFALTGVVNRASSAAEAVVDNYYTRYTPEGRKSVGATGTYLKDMHVWVYNSDFAKRFGMPKKWIDDELEGAKALAYRIDLDVYGVKCGYFSDQENCRPAPACVVDMYLDDNINLPWNTNRRFGSRYGHKSHGFLVGQTQGDRPLYSKLRRVNRGGHNYKLGLDVVYVSGSKIPLNNYHILEYDRDIYKDLDYISGSMTCRSFGKSRDIAIDIDTPVIKESGWIDYQKGVLAHSIKVPNSFLERVEVYDQAQYEPHSLFKELKQRLSNTNTSKE